MTDNKNGTEIKRITAPGVVKNVSLKQIEEERLIDQFVDDFLKKSNRLSFIDLSLFWLLLIFFLLVMGVVLFNLHDLIEVYFATVAAESILKIKQ